MNKEALERSAVFGNAARTKPRSARSTAARAMARSARDTTRRRQRKPEQFDE